MSAFLQRLLQQAQQEAEQAPLFQVWIRSAEVTTSVWVHPGDSVLLPPAREGTVTTEGLEIMHAQVISYNEDLFYLEDQPTQETDGPDDLRAFLLLDIIVPRCSPGVSLRGDETNGTEFEVTICNSRCRAKLERHDGAMVHAKAGMVRLQEGIADLLIRDTRQQSLWRVSQAEEAEEGWWSGTDLAQEDVQLLQTLQQEINNIPVDTEQQRDGAVHRIIVDPDMHPYVHGALPRGDQPYHADMWGRPYEALCDCEWLPTPFAIDDLGRCSIRSYINNLPRNDGPGPDARYRALEQLFELCRPQFEEAMAYSSSLRFIRDDHFGLTHARHVLAATAEPQLFQPQVSLRNRTLHVVTKIEEIQLQPGATFTTSWQVVGMPQENIVAVGLCMLQQDEGLEGGHILLNRAFQEQEAALIVAHVSGHANIALEDIAEGGLLPLGCIPELRTGHVVVFSNALCHCFTELRNTSTIPGRRQLLYFFLVNPQRNSTHISTQAQEVPEQQRTVALETARQQRDRLKEFRRMRNPDWSNRSINIHERRPLQDGLGPHLFR